MQWSVMNAKGDYPALPESLEAECPFHNEDESVPATGAVLIDKRWEPMCQHGLGNYAEDGLMYAVPVAEVTADAVS